MAGKIIEFINNLIGDKPMVQKTQSSESVKETMPTEKNKETISFQQIKSYFFKVSFKLNRMEFLNKCN